MGLGRKPGFRYEGAGAGVINSRLISFSREDLAGIKSDSLTLRVDTSGLAGLPNEGAKVKWFEGYDNSLKEKGEFVITTITPTLFPPSVTIVATAAPWQVADKTRFKERRTRSFENKTLGDIFKEVVSVHGFEPKISQELASIKIPHVDQVNETDAAFVTRLARKYDAVAKPVQNIYVMAKKNQTKTVTGKSIPPYTVSVLSNNNPSSPSFINCSRQSNSRASIKGVKASWTNQSTAEEKSVEVGSVPFKKIRDSFNSEGEAITACQSELKRAERESFKLHLSLPGDPDLVAEGVLVLDKSFPEELAGRWSVESIKAAGAASSYRCNIVATSL